MLRFPAIQGCEKRTPNLVATGHGCQRISVTNVSTSPLLAIVVLQGAESLIVRVGAGSQNLDIDHHRSIYNEYPTDLEKLGNVKDVFFLIQGDLNFWPRCCHAMPLWNCICWSWQGQHAEGMEETERRIATLRASRALGSCGFGFVICDGMAVDMAALQHTCHHLSSSVELN